jgi:putative membrane protein
MNRTFKKAIFILACIFMLAENGLAQPWGYWGPGMMGWGYGGGWIWSIIMLVFWVAVIVGIFFLIRWLVTSTGVGGQARPEESAVEILKRRYAKGEINKQEYEEKKKDLT